MSIVLEGVTKRYGGMATVDDLHLEVGDGELYVLLGESGSGKSTILRLIAGLTPVDGGRIHLQGRDVTDLPPQRRGTGLVFQNYSLFQHMTVAQNVEFGLMIRRAALEERQRIRASLLEMVGLAGLDDRYPAQLSGGQQQRVALARALAYQPDVLLLDEPFGALDAKTRSYLRRELRRIQRELGITAIFVTHDREEAFELADRVGVLLRGRLIASGVPQSLYSEPPTPYVANLLGEANVLLGRVGEEGLRVGELRLRAAKAELAVEQGRSVLVHFRPEEIDVANEEQGVTGQALGPVHVTEFSFAGAVLKLRLRLEASVQTPTPRSPAEEESARTIVATLPTEKFGLLDGKQLWAGLKRYQVLPGDPLRAVAVVDSGRPGQSMLDLIGDLASVETIKVQVLNFSRDGRARLEEVSGVAAMEPTPGETEGGSGAPPPLSAILAGLRPDLPDVLMVEKRVAQDLLRSMTPRPDARLRRHGTAILAVPPGKVRLHRILVATAAGAPGREDVRFAARLARRLQAEMVLLHVVADRTLPLDLDKLVARKIPQAIHLKRDMKLVQTIGIQVQAVLRAGEPAGEILQEAATGGAEILVIGAHLPRPAAWRGEGDLVRRIVELSPIPTAILYARLP